MSSLGAGIHSHDRDAGFIQRFNARYKRDQVFGTAKDESVNILRNIVIDRVKDLRSIRLCIRDQGLFISQLRTFVLHADHQCLDKLHVCVLNDHADLRRITIRIFRRRFCGCFRYSLHCRFRISCRRFGFSCCRLRFSRFRFSRLRTAAASRQSEHHANRHQNCK